MHKKNQERKKSPVFKKMSPIVDGKHQSPREVIMRQIAHMDCSLEIGPYKFEHYGERGTLSMLKGGKKDGKETHYAMFIPGSATKKEIVELFSRIDRYEKGEMVAAKNEDFAELLNKTTIEISDGDEKPKIKGFVAISGDNEIKLIVEPLTEKATRMERFNRMLEEHQKNIS